MKVCRTQTLRRASLLQRGRLDFFTSSKKLKDGLAYLQVRYLEE
jgi:hypothetical protein